LLKLDLLSILAFFVKVS
jgi:hypothetical protein